MTTSSTTPSYKGFRFPQEIISHAVWLYHRFSLSFRDVEELLFARGVMVTYETVRQWCRKFGQTYAKELRRRRGRRRTRPAARGIAPCCSTVATCGDSCVWPGVRHASSGRLVPSRRRWIVVLKPPTERPNA